MPVRKSRDAIDEQVLLDGALAGDGAATRRLIHMLAPIVQARVARVLVRRRGGNRRDIHQEVEDLAQEVFAALFGNNGRVLRAWDQSRGLTLASFCGLVAEREAASILRSGRRSPWTETATEMESLERDMLPQRDAEKHIASREQLEQLSDRLTEALSPIGLQLFQRLVVDEESVEHVCATTGMTADAVYAWRSRLGKMVRRLLIEIGVSQPRLPTTPPSTESMPSPKTPDEEVS